MDLFEEGIERATEALEIHERLGDTVGQAECLINLAGSLHGDKRFDAAEEAASRAVSLLPEEGKQSLVCESHTLLGKIYRSKNEQEKAIHHLEVALGIASLFNWHNNLFWIHYNLAWPCIDKDRLDDVQVHIERAKSHAVANRAYSLCFVMLLQAVVWYKQGRHEEAMSEVLRAVDACEKLGIADGAEACRTLAQRIQKETARLPLVNSP